MKKREKGKMKQKRKYIKYFLFLHLTLSSDQFFIIGEKLVFIDIFYHFKKIVILLQEKEVTKESLSLLTRR